MELLEDYKNLLEDIKEFIERESLFCPLNLGYLENEQKLSIVSQNESLDNDCKNCTLNNGPSNRMLGVGGEKPDFFIIGNRPSLDSSLRLRSFNNASGNLFTSILVAAKIQKEKIFITTLNKCYNKENSGEQCKTVLNEQLLRYSPKLIIMLGKEVASTLLHTKLDLTAARSKTWEYRGIPVVVTYHPDDLLKQRDLTKELVEDIKKAQYLVSSEGLREN